MMMSHRKLVPSFFFLMLMSASTLAQDSLTFEETIEDDSKLPVDKRVPVENKALCSDNELYYPGDQESDWICDCKPAYLYVPNENKCFPAYRQGPCSTGQFLVLKENEYTPFCMPNRCKTDGYVPIENRCVLLGSPCYRKDTRRRYGVDEITLRVGCLPIPERQRTTTTTAKPELNNRFEEPPANKYCYNGTKRNQNKECTLSVE